MKPIVLLLRDADQIVERIVHPIKVLVVYDHAARHGVSASEEKVYGDMLAHTLAVIPARLVLHYFPFLGILYHLLVEMFNQKVQCFSIVLKFYGSARLKI